MSSQSGGAPPSAQMRIHREVSRSKSFHQAFLDVKVGIPQPTEDRQRRLEVTFSGLYKRALQRAYATPAEEGDGGTDGDDNGLATAPASSSTASSSVSAAGPPSKGRFAGVASRMKLLKSAAGPSPTGHVASGGGGGAPTAAEEGDTRTAVPASSEQQQSLGPPPPRATPPTRQLPLAAESAAGKVLEAANGATGGGADSAGVEVAAVLESASPTTAAMRGGGGSSGSGGGDASGLMALLKGLYDAGGQIDDSEDGQQQPPGVPPSAGGGEGPAAAGAGAAGTSAGSAADDLKKALKDQMDGCKDQMDEAMKGPMKNFSNKLKAEEGSSAAAATGEGAASTAAAAAGAAAAGSAASTGGGGGGGSGGSFFASVKAAAQESLKEAGAAVTSSDEGGDEDDDDDDGDDDDEDNDESADGDDDDEQKDDGADDRKPTREEEEEGRPRERERGPGSGGGGGGWGRLKAPKAPRAPKPMGKAAMAAAAAGGGTLAAAVTMGPRPAVHGKEPWLPSGLSPHQVELRARARELVLEHVLPYAADWDEQRTLPRGLFAAAGRAGFCAMVAPLLSGGRGWSYGDAVGVFEVLGAADLNSAALLAHQNTVTWMVGKFAGPTHKLPLTAVLGSGMAVGTAAAVEPQQTGPHRVDLTASFAIKYKDQSGDYWILNGYKDRVPLCGDADVYLVAARTEPGPDGLTLFLLPKVYPGLAFLGQPADSLGVRSLTYGNMALTCCIVRDDMMKVVAGKKAFKAVKEGEDRFRLFLAAAAVGSAGGAVALAQEWLAEPSQRHFSNDLLGYQALQHRLVGLASRVAAARLAVQGAAAALDALEKSAPAQVAMAKRYCVTTGLAVLEGLRTMFGAASVHVSYPLARVRRNLISYQLLGGDMELCVELAWTGLVGKRKAHGGKGGGGSRKGRSRSVVGAARSLSSTAASMPGDAEAAPEDS